MYKVSLDLLAMNSINTPPVRVGAMNLASDLIGSRTCPSDEDENGYPAACSLKLMGHILLDSAETLEFIFF